QQSLDGAPRSEKPPQRSSREAWRGCHSRRFIAGAAWLRLDSGGIAAHASSQPSPEEPDAVRSCPHLLCVCRPASRVAGRKGARGELARDELLYVGAALRGHSAALRLFRRAVKDLRALQREGKRVLEQRPADRRLRANPR